MPLSLNPAAAALVVVDLVAGTVSGPAKAHRIEDVVANTRALLRAFRAVHRPVAVAKVGGTPVGRTSRSEHGGRQFPAAFTALADGIDVTDSDIVVARVAWSAFAHTDLHRRLTDNGVTEVVLAGLATSFGIESTARDAYDRGYDVVLATDAMTDISLAAHDHSVSWVFPALGQPVSTADVVAALSP